MCVRAQVGQIRASYLYAVAVYFDGGVFGCEHTVATIGLKGLSDMEANWKYGKRLHRMLTLQFLLSFDTQSTAGGPKSISKMDLEVTQG